MIGQSVSRNSIILGIFAVVTTGMVVLTANLTRDSIAKAVEETLKKSLFDVMPRNLIDNDLLHDQITLEGSPLLGTKTGKAAYVARKNGQPSGTILQVVAPEGYGGSINLLVGVDVTGTITGVRVIPPHFETPGLGDAIELQKSPWILSFNGKSLHNTPEGAWRVKKDGGDFDAFTGATITPRAVVDSVYKSLQYFEANKQHILHPVTVQDTQPTEEANHGGH